MLVLRILHHENIKDLARLVRIYRSNLKSVISFHTEKRLPSFDVSEFGDIRRLKITVLTFSKETHSLSTVQV